MSVEELMRRLDFVESRIKILKQMLKNKEIDPNEFRKLYREWALASLRLRLILQHEIYEEMLKRKLCG